MRNFPAPIGSGFGLAVMGAPSGSPPLSLAQADTLKILNIWGETLTVKRRSLSYGTSGKATVTWVTICTITGDWQPLPGSAIIEEAGLEVKSSSQIYTVYDANVLAGDRIYRADGSYEYVNYIRKHEDHLAVRMTSTQGE